MIFNKQPLTEYGFTDFNGNTWCDGWVDSYNNLTNDINKSAGIEVYSNSLTSQEREFFLNQRHKLFTMYLNIKRDAKQARYLTKEG